MDLKDLAKDFKNEPSYMFKRKLNELVRTNHRFTNLGTNNRKLVIDLIGKHSDKIRKGWGISADTIQRESYKLYQNRIKLGLTDEDLKDVKEIMGMFKK